MILSIRELWESLNVQGTEGTQGTTNKDAASRCSLPENHEGTQGTNWGSGEDFVPSVPSVKSGREQETANVYAAVPCVPSVPSQKTDSAISKLFLVQDPAYWEDDFSRWALAECLFRDRCSGGIKALHAHFCDWCLARQTTGCMLDTFYALLEGEGFKITDGMVYGLLLRADWEATFSPQQVPAPAAEGRAVVMVGGRRWTP